MIKVGRVIKSTGKWYKVSANQQIYECRLPGIFRLNKQEVTNPVAVGDMVKFTVGDDGSGLIKEIKERLNYLPRQATHGRRGEQILVSNVDRAWVVQSVKSPKLNLGFIDRFLVTCEAYDIPAGIIINKMDLAGNEILNYVDDISLLYRSLNYQVIHTSVKDKKSMNRLSELLKDGINVFIGPSGVGKTSLLNTIDPQLALKIGEVSSYSDKGKHTTTFASLVPLQGGGYVVDTPGIREFGIVNIGKAELSLHFPEMIEPREKCKFYNCTHYHEPKCGVREAYENGAIDADRYASYLNILDTLDS